MPAADTIAAIATAAGRGGIGIVRVSGSSLAPLASALTGKQLEPRRATFATFIASDGAPLDQGLALFFPAPHSFTGEDVLELHGHGGNAVMHLLLQRCIELGCRLAEPGEFTRRAFLNDKLDLAQAESVADLIDAASSEAARSAVRSLVGEFSRRIRSLVEQLIDLRMHVEACIDFPEEEIDPADRAAVQAKLANIQSELERVLAQARQGAVLHHGLTVALIGRPNVGKSSLLNRLAGEEVAIVTPIAGTTRDQIRVTISLEGVPIHLVDTAGLRETDDPIERIGIERTWQAIEKAGAAMLIAEAGEAIGEKEARIVQQLPANLPLAWVYNKIDLYGIKPSVSRDDRHVGIRVSAQSGEGVEHVRGWLLETAGWQPQGEGVFMARARHLAALTAARDFLRDASAQQHGWELLAEDLRLAQAELGTITGEFTADDLLGEIFSRFCIGK